jgi:hypothetical protein
MGIVAPGTGLVKTFTSILLPAYFAGGSDYIDSLHS